MECHSRRHWRAVALARRFLHGGRVAQRGQSTVEYVLVVVGLFAIVVGFAAFVRAISSGSFESVVLDSLSHRLIRGIADVVAF